jgi:F-type H+-transporting ATPase subunit epsilon
MHLSVITPEKTVFKDEVEEITLPTLQGEITILPNHIPLVAALKSGAARVLKGGKEYFVAVTGGMVQVKAGNEITVLADSADRAEELDEKKIEAAHAEAVKLLSEVRAGDDVEYAALASKIEHELARLHVARKHRAVHLTMKSDTE